MDKAALITLTSATTKDLEQAIMLFTDEQFNQSPSPDSWTPGQVTEHIHLSCNGMVQILNGPTAMSFREADEKVETIKGIFLDFNTKMKSPDFIQPSAGPHSKEELSNKLKEEFTAMLKAAETLPLSETCLAFQLPNLGSFTRMEWLSFVNYHTQRHIHQLKNIAAQLQNTAAAISTGN